MMPILSLCIPTNGVVEWVFPVLESIYGQGINEEIYEVVITNNGNNDEFDKKMRIYAESHNNLVYEKTSAQQFLNQVEAFRMARGKFIKFVNHRFLMMPGSIQHILDVLENAGAEKTVIYFLNGYGKEISDNEVCNSFDEFISKLSYWSSWSGGLACWKKDMDIIAEDQQYNELFPHTTILLNKLVAPSKYIIDNTNIFKEIPVGNMPKGGYNLFYAFGVEYINILFELAKERRISWKTFLKIKNDNMRFVADLYLDYIILKKNCSYDLNCYKDFLNVYYSVKCVRLKALKQLKGRIINKGKRILNHGSKK